MQDPRKIEHTRPPRPAPERGRRGCGGWLALIPNWQRIHHARGSELDQWIFNARSDSPKYVVVNDSPKYVVVSDSPNQRAYDRIYVQAGHATPGAGPLVRTLVLGEALFNYDVVNPRLVQDSELDGLSLRHRVRAVHRRKASNHPAAPTNAREG